MTMDNVMIMNNNDNNNDDNGSLFLKTVVNP